MDERLQFDTRVLDGEKIAALCRKFDTSRTAGYKIFNRYKNSGPEKLGDQSRRPYRQDDRLAFQLERTIIRFTRPRLPSSLPSGWRNLTPANGARSLTPSPRCGGEKKLEQVIPFFAFAPEVRRIVYTTTATESLHSQVRKSVCGRGQFQSDKHASKLIYLVLQNVEAKWTRPPIAWHRVKAQFAIHCDNRIVVAD